MPFLRLVLQHVLPKGFRRARNEGFLHRNSKRLIALLRRLVFKPCIRPPVDAATVNPTERPKLLCHCCGAVMTIMRRRILPVIAPPARDNRVGLVIAQDQGLNPAHPCLRACLRSSEQQSQKRQIHELQAGVEPAFAIFPQTPVFLEPGGAIQSDVEVFSAYSSSKGAST